MKNIFNNVECKEITSGVVTFLDVLGWKGIYNRDNDAIKKLINISKQGKKLIESIISEYKSISIEMFLISDTIIIVSYNTDLKEGEDKKRAQQFVIHAKIGIELIKEGLGQNILFRGATSYGRYYFSKEDLVFMGEAIDEAAEWHEFSNWCGIIATPSSQMIIENVINNENNISKLFYKDLINKWIEYEYIPLKSRDIKLKYVLNWIEKTKLKDLNNILSKNGPYTTSIASKYLNTLQFARYINEKNHR